MLTQHLADLTHTNTEVRYAAAHALGAPQFAAADGVAAALIAALPDTNSKVQYAVISALVKHTIYPALHPILDVLLPDVDNRIWALLNLNLGMRLRSGLLALAQAGDLALSDRLHAALDRADFTILQRALLIRLIGRTADPRRTDWLIDVLLHGHPMLRGPAAEALGYLRDRRAIAALLTSARDLRADDQIREPAVIALGRLGDISVFDDLAAGLSDENAFVRAASATALGELGDRRAIELLSQVMVKDTDIVTAAAFAALQRFSRSSLIL